jgi:ATP-dependent DNA ligase
MAPQSIRTHSGSVRVGVRNRQIRHDAAVGSFPQGSSGPVAVALARAEDVVPGPGRMPGGSVYEPKWDGYRLVVVVEETGTVRLWSR